MAGWSFARVGARSSHPCPCCSARAGGHRPRLTRGGEPGAHHGAGWETDPPLPRRPSGFRRVLLTRFATAERGHAISQSYTHAGSDFDWERALDRLQVVADRARQTLGARDALIQRLMQAVDTHCTVLRQKATERESDSSLAWLETLHDTATSIDTLAAAAAAVSSHPHKTPRLG